MKERHLKENQNFIGKMYVNYELIDGLTFSGNAAIDMRQRFTKEIRPTWELWTITEDAETLDQKETLMTLEDDQRMERQITLYGTVNYVKTIANHNINVLVGAQQEEFVYRQLIGEASDFATNDLTEINAGIDPLRKMAQGTRRDWAMRSFFGRFEFDYKGKYLFDANARYDGSSKFNEAGRWEVFPSFSAGWRISEEDFMSNVSFLSNLKIRGSWGQLGNNNTGSNYVQGLGKVGDKVKILLNVERVGFEFGKLIIR